MPEGEFVEKKEKELTDDQINLIMSSKELRNYVLLLIGYGKNLEFQEKDLARSLNAKSEEELERKIRDMAIIALSELIDAVGYRTLESNIMCTLRHETTSFGDNLTWLECSTTAEGERAEHLLLPPEKIIYYTTKSGDKYEVHVFANIPEGENINTSKILYTVTVEPATQS